VFPQAELLKLQKSGQFPDEPVRHLKEKEKRMRIKV
jgi:hypothetical protein